MPCAIVDQQQPVLDLELHVFGDASTKGVGVAVYTVVRQQASTNTTPHRCQGTLGQAGPYGSLCSRLKLVLRPPQPGVPERDAGRRKPCAGVNENKVVCGLKSARVRCLSTRVQHLATLPGRIIP